MLKLNANKSKLHALVRRYEELPGLRSVGFTKAPRNRSYWLEWYGGGLRYKSYFSVCAGVVILVTSACDCDGKEVSHVVHRPSDEVLNDLGLLEEETPCTN